MKDLLPNPRTGVRMDKIRKVGFAFIAVTVTIFALRPNTHMPNKYPRDEEYIIRDTFRLTGVRWGGAGTPNMFLTWGKHPNYDVVVDVGAFDASDYTIPAYSVGYTVFCFELSPLNQARVLKTFQQKGLIEGTNFTIVRANPLSFDYSKRPHIYFFPFGISDRQGPVYVSDEAEMAGIAHGETGEKSYTYSIDDIIGDGEKVYLFKSDTQGHEYGVFHGAATLLRRSVKLIHLEFWPKGLRDNGADPVLLLKFLINNGFSCYNAGTHPLYVPLTYPQDVEGFVNFLESVPPSMDPIGGWEDIFCSK